MADYSLFFARQRVHLADAVYLVAEKLHADGSLAGVCKIYFNHIAPHTKFVAHKVYIITLILKAHKAAHQVLPV